MNGGAFGENFPYSNFHDLNMDWIIKIAKDFLDQYSHIQETLNNGLEELDKKADELEALLQQWYNTHSQDIANQLADALNDLNTWYTEHEGYLDQYVTNSINSFNQAADQKAQQTIASIPADYTALSNDVSYLNSAINEKAPIELINQNNLLFGKRITDNKYYWVTWNNDPTFYVVVVPVVSGTQYTMAGIRFVSGQSEGLFNNTGYSTTQTWQSTVTGNVYVTVHKKYKNIAFFCTKENYDNDNYGTLGTPILNNDLIANGLGDSTKLLVSQKLLKDSLSDLEITTPQIKGMTPNGKTVDGDNLFSPALLVATGKYVQGINPTTGKAVLTDGAPLNTYMLPVDGASTYTFTYCRTAVVVSDLEYTAVSTLLSYATSIDSTGGNYILFSFNPLTYPISTYSITKPVPQYIIPNDWDVSESVDRKLNILFANGAYHKTGTLANGSTWTAPLTNCKKNNDYSFLCKVSTMGTLLIGHGKNVYEGSWLEINSTKVILHNYSESDSTTVLTHGLTIADYLYIQIHVSVGKAHVSIYSNKQSYNVSDLLWDGDGNGSTFVENSGCTISECFFTWSSKDFRKSVWMFGDSYFGMTNDSRWVYYMMQAGYGDNVLLNAYPGEATPAAITALQNALQNYGCPKYVVWCLGMNDGSDPDGSTPSAQWLTGITTLISLSQQYGFTPILATIPSVDYPISHEGKNNYVRNSDYRYIDFAKAVGATAQGTWYNGMLSADKIHPTSYGAKALYYQAIADVPEITFESP